jgi:hypothetical protein
LEWTSFGTCSVLLIPREGEGDFFCGQFVPALRFLEDCCTRCVPSLGLSYAFEGNPLCHVNISVFHEIRFWRHCLLIWVLGWIVIWTRHILAAQTECNYPSYGFLNSRCRWTSKHRFCSAMGNHEFFLQFMTSLQGVIILTHTSNLMAWT